MRQPIKRKAVLMRVLWFILGFVLAFSPATAQEYAVDAAASVILRGTLSVGWAAPQTRGGIVEIRPVGENARRVAYAYANANPQVIEAPEAPGEYVLVLVFDGVDRASRPLRVEMATASLSAPAQAEAGGAIIVTWAGPDSRGDVVTFATPDGGPIRGASYAYVGNSRDGTVTVQAPRDAAAYDLVYVSGETVLARSRVQVGGIAAVLHAPAQIAAGASVIIAFDGPLNTGDRITFAQRDGEPIGAASYAYAGAATDNRVVLRAFEDTGRFDVVYLSGDRVIGRTPIEIVPVALRIAAPDEVPARLVFETLWTGQGHQGDRIVMTEPGQDDGVPYAYIDPQVGSVAMAAPASPGAYDLVYITRGGNELARRPVTVTPAALDPGQLEVPFLSGAGLGADDAVEVILDASGSMLQRQGGLRRIEIARRRLIDLVARTIPEGTNFALRVFGNREADACRTDLEIPLGPLDAASAMSVISGINAVNLAKTPIAESILLTARDLARVTGSRVVILITDGEETCDGDPGRAIETLRAGGIDVRLNIVGYAIDDADLARTFEAWAAAGGGTYFDAADAEQLGAGLLRATAAPFAVRSADGALVAQGLAGDPPVTLPAGAYTVQIGARTLEVAVRPRDRTVVTP
jgi:lysophospholipid acyltransferase (LPLAT)-like uncharacterized protein